MTNKRQKGLRRERELRNIFTEAGYLVDFKPWSKWSSKDLFNMFDFVAIKAGIVIFVQVKSNRSDFYKARKKTHKWLKKHNLCIDCEVWLKENRKAWRGSEIDETGYHRAVLPKLETC